ncbi:adhesion G protein-coupled receptor G3-like [Arapaima gigas]
MLWPHVYSVLSAIPRSIPSGGDSYIIRTYLFRSLCIMTPRDCLWNIALLVIYICSCQEFHASSCYYNTDIDSCLENQTSIYITNDNYLGIIFYNNFNCSQRSKKTICVIPLIYAGKNSALFVEDNGNYYIVRLKIKVPVRPNITLHILNGTNCTLFPSSLEAESNCLVESINIGTIVCESVPSDSNGCQGLQNDMIINITSQNKTCNLNMAPSLSLPSKVINISNAARTPEDAAKAMKNLESLLTLMGNEGVAAVSMGNITGILAVIPKEEQSQNSDFGLTSDHRFGKRKTIGNVTESVPVVFTIPSEAFQGAALARNVVFVGVFRFPSFGLDNYNSKILKNEVFAIEMGTNISNLSKPIQLQFRNVKGNETPICSSWDGEGNQLVWTKNGCNTTSKNDSIICSCSHLTFFAVLMSPQQNVLPNISSTDLKSLTYITYIGCGMSMFFLGVALFVYFLLRRAKASKSTRILMQLFLAMFLLNLTFLSNEWMANLLNNSLCIFIAAAMHYFMLSTLTWFAIEAFHLYLQIIKVFNIDIRHFMPVVLIVGWGVPFLAPLVILILGQYGLLNISSTDGNVAHLCWITNSFVIYIVNVGYYALVFVFILIVFIMVVQRITYLKKTVVGKLSKRSFAKESFTVIGLCGLLGITWGFAFFSYGSLVIPSYYIFTILNSFQGFFLFLYYYNTRIVNGDEKLTSTTRTSQETSHTTNHTSLE